MVFFRELLDPFEKSPWRWLLLWPVRRSFRLPSIWGSKRSDKFHFPSCEWARRTNPTNKRVFGSVKEAQGARSKLTNERQRIRSLWIALQLGMDANTSERCLRTNKRKSSTRTAAQNDQHGFYLPIL